MIQMIRLAVLAILASSLLGACAYQTVAPIGGKTVVITRNDLFLFGALRKVYVCQVTPTGLQRCAEGENP